MTHHDEISDERLRAYLRRGEIRFAGNLRLKIYGTLTCKSGKRIKRSHWVFYKEEQEALDQGYSPCGHCMKTAYQLCKHEFIRL